MTKPSARQLFTDRLRTHMFKLQADEDFVAIRRKLNNEEKQMPASLPSQKLLAR